MPRSLKSLLVGLTFGWSVFAAAQPLPVPPLTARVIDQTATLDDAQRQRLTLTLQSFEARKGSQLAVLIVPSTAPEAIEQYALRVAEQWKLGRKGIDDGALLLIAKADRTVRIEVGYGLEGALTDATSKRIVSEIITPRFQRGDFYGGIDACLQQMMRVIDGEALPAPVSHRAAGLSKMQTLLPVILLLAVAVGGVLRAVLGRLPGAVVTAGGVGLLAWWFAGALSIALGAGLLALLFNLFGGGLLGARGLGGLYGGQGSGGFGGGFGGGGGGFGGGGASGKW
ncbi:MAG: TPM domain-containing protein [Burkholderiaceae bacterium]